MQLCFPNDPYCSMIFFYPFVIVFFIYLKPRSIENLMKGMQTLSKKKSIEKQKFAHVLKGF